MVDLSKELERRKEKRLTRAHYIKSIRFVLCMMVVGFGLINFLFLRTIYNLEPEGSAGRYVALLVQCLSVAVQLGILWLIYWSWKVLDHDGRKL